MRQIKKIVYLIDEHPDKNKCFEWIRANWHDLNEHSVRELQNSIKKLSEIIGGNCDFSIGQYPKRGEYIRFSNYDAEELKKLNAADCPLTGYFLDYDLIEGLREGDANKALRVLHQETEYLYSDKGITEFCIGNDYEFDEDGTFYAKT